MKYSVPMSANSRLQYPIHDIYNHLETVSSNAYPETSSAISSTGHSHASDPMMSASSLDKDTLKEGGIQDYFSVPRKRPGQRTHRRHVSSGHASGSSSTSSDEQYPPLPPSRTSSRGSNSSISSASSKYSRLPRLVTQFHSSGPTNVRKAWKYMYRPAVRKGIPALPPRETDLGSKWSPDSVTANSRPPSPPSLGRACSPHSRLQYHLSFVSRASPSSGGEEEAEEASAAREIAEDNKVDLRQRGLGALSHLANPGDISDDTDGGSVDYENAELEEDRELLQDNVSVGGPSPQNVIKACAKSMSDVEDAYDTDTTLELDSGESSEGGFSRQNSAGGGGELCAPGTSKRAKYTHGHALQRMPGQVKGFGEVPHYHHQVHGCGLVGDELDGNTSAGIVSEAREAEEGVVPLRPEGSAHDMGLAFINLNLTETGRDVRVLVRSKQTDVGNIDDYGRTIEELIAEEPMLFEDTDDEYHRKLIMHPHGLPKYMIKRLPLSSSELLVLLELNQADVRNAAWNPAPHVICAVDRPRTSGRSEREVEGEKGRLGKDDDDVYLFFEPLQEAKNNPWLQTVGDYLDCFKELLEGLTFLHEHRIAGLRCGLARSFMRSREPLPASDTASVGSTPGHLRYRYVDFAEAYRVPGPRVFDESRGPMSPATRAANDTLRKDVRDLASVFSQILERRIPQVRVWFNPLVEAMRRGRLTADGARRLLADLTENLVLEAEGETFGVLESSARPESGLDTAPTAVGSDAEEDDTRHPQYYYESGDSDDPNEEEEDGGSMFARGRSGTIMAVVAIPTLENARVTYMDIVPE